jgi:uncharacterized protein YidB (DUF937 family)
MLPNRYSRAQCSYVSTWRCRIAAGREAQWVSAVDDILADIPMDQLAAQLGVDEATAEQAARQALPALLGGMQANAEDPAAPGPWLERSATIPAT